jgi:hypothetical protein
MTVFKAIMFCDNKIMDLSQVSCNTITKHAILCAVSHVSTDACASKLEFQNNYE